MTTNDWTDFKYEGSPFFISSVDSSKVDEVLALIEKRFPSDYALARVLTQVMLEHLMLSIPMAKEQVLEKKHGTTSKDIGLYFFGLIAPLILTQAAFLWIMGEAEARKFISSQSERSEQDKKLKVYLANSLSVCALMLRDAKDCQIIFEYTRQQPFDPSVYFRVGVEAAHDALITYAVRVADRQVRKEMGL